MKQKLCLLLALILLLGLFAGCDVQNALSEPAEDQNLEQNIPEQNTPEPDPKPEISLEDLEPPEMAEDFVSRFNDALKNEDIPVEFVFALEEQYDQDIKRSIYRADIAGSGVSETFDVSVYYAQTLSDPIERIEVWIADNATEQERELYLHASVVAAKLCDKNITREKTMELLAAEGSRTLYIVDNGAFGSFFYLGYKVNELVKVSSVFYQPKDVTHTVCRIEGSGEQFYRIDFTVEGEDLYAYRREEAMVTPAPDVTIYDAAGNPVKLSDFVGKPVVLNAWATWCGFCVQELPYFHDAYLEYGDQIEFLIVNLNESVETSEQFFGDNGYSFPVYVNSAQELESAFEISGIPVTLFIDSNGNILRHSEGMLHEEEFQYYFNWLRAEIDA